MVIHQGIDDLPRFSKAVVTFGSFDGVHYGHRKIFKRMQEEAKAIGGTSVVVTFDPHPRQVIYPSDQGLRLLSTLKEKISLFKNTGIDHLIICPFTVEFSQLRPDDYIENFVIKYFDPAVIVIGYDHRFGLNRQGNIDFLRSSKWIDSFEVLEIEQQLVDASKVSSTRIRQHVEQGQIQQANDLLGHNYLLSGQVITGQKIGSTIGYPTANLEIDEKIKLLPAHGIYAAKIHKGSEIYSGMLYIGNRPSIEDGGEVSIEVNVFDFQGNLYGAHLVLELVDYIREDQEFENLDALKSRLAVDEIAVREVLARVPRKMLSVVVLNYNGIDYLKQFLGNVLRTIDQPNWELVVVDNASTDHSAQWLSEHHPSVRVIELEENHGFAAGYNEGLKQVNAEYIILLNSDVEVTPGWIEPLLKGMNVDPLLVACQPKIRSFHDKNKFEYAGAAGGLIDVLGYPFCRGRILAAVEEDLGQYDDASSLFWVSGAAMCVRKSLFEDLGGFDKDYFAHMEEIDLCWRFKRAGYHLQMIPNSLVYHVGGGTLSYLSPRKTYLNFRNNISTLIKNERARRLIWLLPTRVLLDWLGSVHFLLAREWKNSAAVWKAHFHVLVNLGRILKVRTKYNRAVEAHRVKQDQSWVGRYKGSIIWDYFVLQKRNTSEVIQVKSTNPS